MFSCERLANIAVGGDLRAIGFVAFFDFLPRGHVASDCAVAYVHRVLYPPSLTTDPLKMSSACVNATSAFVAIPCVFISHGSPIWLITANYAGS